MQHNDHETLIGLIRNLANKLSGTLPKGEYQELEKQVIGQLLHARNPEELNKLKGDIQKAITNFDDLHELVAKTDSLMATPPFNVNEIDYHRIN